MSNHAGALTMSVSFAGRSHPGGVRWWRLDPRVAAHLRAAVSPAGGLVAAGLAAVCRSPAARDDGLAAFALTQWADTEWSDTRSDWLYDAELQRHGDLE
jgi:hypothetical protein